jgi:DNA-binding transcriptional ArsR family regulator
MRRVDLPTLRPSRAVGGKRPGGAMSGIGKNGETDGVERLYEDLGEKERVFVRQGICAPGKTRSEMIQSAAVSAVNRGWTREQFYSAMLRRSNKGAKKILEIREQRGPRAAADYLDRCWDKAVEFVKRNPAVSNREETRQQIRLMRAAISRMAWPRISGSVDLAVLLVHLDIAETLGSLTYSASLRQIAELAGLTYVTVFRSQKRLRRFLTRLPSRDSKASRWKLGTAVTRPGKSAGAPTYNNINLTGVRTNVISTAQGPSHDVWHQQGLGKGCWRTWNALSVGSGLSVKQLAQKLSARPRTVSQRLERLSGCGLVCCLGGRWYRLVRDLDLVAAELATLGRLAARKRRHKSDREWYERQRREDQKRKNADSTVILIYEAAGTRIEPEQPLPRPKPDMLQAALSYARRGLRVLPLHSIRDGRCTCGKPCDRRAGKHPIGILVPNGVKRATNDAGLIRQWWARFPEANVGIATGEIAPNLYLYAIDVDPRNGGNDTFVTLMMEGGLPETAVSQTGGGGSHFC